MENNFSKFIKAFLFDRKSIEQCISASIKHNLILTICSISILPLLSHLFLKFYLNVELSIIFYTWFKKLLQSVIFILLQILIFSLLKNNYQLDIINRQIISILLFSNFYRGFAESLGILLSKIPFNLFYLIYSFFLIKECLEIYVKKDNKLNGYILISTFFTFVGYYILNRLFIFL